MIKTGCFFLPALIVAACACSTAQGELAEPVCPDGTFLTENICDETRASCRARPRLTRSCRQTDDPVGLLHGPSWHVEDGNVLLIGEFENGFPVGERRRWYRGGQVRSISYYSQGKKEGLHERYARNGQLVQRKHYARGRRHGESRWWWANGTLRKEATFVHGRYAGLHRRWHRNGQLAREHTYLDDGSISIGTWRSWHDNGKPRSIGCFTETGRTGLFLVLHRDTSARVLSHLVDGVHDGIRRVWDEDGRLVTYDEWRLGERITREEYGPDDEPDPDRAAPPEDPLALWRQIEEDCRAANSAD